MDFTVLRTALLTASTSSRRLWAGCFLAAWSVYALTAFWLPTQISDAHGAAWAGWQFVHTGSFDLGGNPAYQDPAGVTAGSDGRLMVSRTMGVVLSGLPGHVLLLGTGAAPTTSGTLAATLFAAGAVANLLLAMTSFLPLRLAALAAGTAGFGTALWTVGADQLWSHGPDAFWLSAALLAVTRGAGWTAGAALGAAVLTRPHLGVVAVVLGISWAWHERRLVRLLHIGVPVGAAVAVLQAWNAWWYGAPTVGGAYGYASANVSRAPTDAFLPYLEAVAGTLVSPTCGVLLYTPVVGLVLWATRRHRRAAPWWAAAAAVGGCVYLAVQLRVSFAFDGGGSFYGNRYAIEALLLATPYGVAVLRSWCCDAAGRRAAAASSAALSVAMHAYPELLAHALVGLGTASPWVAWYPAYIARIAGLAGAAAALGLLAAVLLAGLHAHRSAPQATPLIPAPRASRRAAARTRS